MTIGAFELAVFAFEVEVCEVVVKCFVVEFDDFKIASEMFAMTYGAFFTFYIGRGMIPFILTDECIYFLVTGEAF